jgi:putative flippase GtrA
MFARHLMLPCTQSLRQPMQRYGKFLVVGMLNALVDIIVFNVFTLVLPAHSAWVTSCYNTVAVGAALVNSYLWNRYWTFADITDGSRRERILFWVQAAVNILINNLVVIAATAYLTETKSLPPYLSSNLAKVLAMLASSSVSYVLLRLWVFGGHPRQVR